MQIPHNSLCTKDSNFPSSWDPTVFCLEGYLSPERSVILRQSFQSSVVTLEPLSQPHKYGRSNSVKTTTSFYWDVNISLDVGDGIFDRLSNDEIIECVWETARDRTKYTSVHDFCGIAVENIMKLAVYKKTLDNITVVMLGLEGL